jgi:predicted nucleic acid-binding Zn ribbon protein
MTWGPQPIGEEFRRELGRFGPQGSIGEIVAAWPAAVGQAIADNAWPARVARDGTLHVATSSSAWAFELTQLEETVRARLAERLGKETPPQLRFAAGRLPERGAKSVPVASRTAREPGSAERARGAEIAAPIDDPELRELVARAAAASLLR